MSEAQFEALLGKSRESRLSPSWCSYCTDWRLKGPRHHLTVLMVHVAGRVANGCNEALLEDRVKEFIAALREASTPQECPIADCIETVLFKGC